MKLELMVLIPVEKVFTEIITWRRNNDFHFSPKGKNVHWMDNCAWGVKLISMTLSKSMTHHHLIFSRFELWFQNQNHQTEISSRCHHQNHPRKISLVSLLIRAVKNYSLEKVTRKHIQEIYVFTEWKRPSSVQIKHFA